MSAVSASPAASGSVMDPVLGLQHALYRAAKADPGRRFHALRDKVYRRDILEWAWEDMRRNGGAAGIDLITITDVQEYGVVLDVIGPGPQRYPRLQQRTRLGVRTTLEDQARTGLAPTADRSVAADIPTNSVAVSSSMSNSPHRRSTGTSSGSTGASRFPAGAFSTAQHFSSAATTLASYFGARGARGRTTRGLSACFSARRA